MIKGQDISIELLCVSTKGLNNLGLNPLKYFLNYIITWSFTKKDKQK